MPRDTVAGLMNTRSVAFLGFVLGILVMGLAHLYLRKIKKGVTILLSGLGLYLSVALSYIYGPTLQLGTVTFSSWISILFLMPSISFWIWQGYDAYSIATRYNDGMIKGLG